MKLAREFNNSSSKIQLFNPLSDLFLSSLSTLTALTCPLSGWMAHRYLLFSDSHSVVWIFSRLMCIGNIGGLLRHFLLGIVLAVNWKMRSRISSIYPPLKRFPLRTSLKYRLPSSSTLSTLRHWSYVPSRRTISMARTPARIYGQLLREWWLIGVFRGGT